MMMTHVITVSPGETLSGLAAEYGTTWQSLWRANDPPVSNPNLILVGERLTVPGTGWSGPSEPVQTYQAPEAPSAPTASPGGVYAPSGSLGSIPGVPVSFSCIAYRESTNGTNPAAHGNVYGIIPASGYNVAGDSLAQQQQVVRELYAADGLRPWAADGCPGT